MTGPRRLAQEATDQLERELLASAELDHPGEAERQRALASLASTPAWGAPPPTVSWLGWGVAGGAVALGALALVQVMHRRPAHPPPPAVVVAVSPPVAEPAAPPPEPTQASAPAPYARRPARPTAPGLDLEVRLLDRVREAVADGDFARARTSLEAYAAQFPRGALTPEAVVLRIELLRRTGQGAAARMLAQEFLRQHRGSPLCERVRAAIGE
jgi:hypothetical protein